MQGHGDFEQPGHAGGGLEVPNLTLDGTNSHVVTGFDVGPQRTEGG